MVKCVISVIRTTSATRKHMKVALHYSPSPNHILFMELTFRLKIKPNLKLWCLTLEGLIKRGLQGFDGKVMPN